MPSKFIIRGLFLHLALPDQLVTLQPSILLANLTFTDSKCVIGLTRKRGIVIHCDDVGAGNPDGGSRNALGYA
jgi:hypothetical protein